MKSTMTTEHGCACGVTAASGAPRCRACPLVGSSGPTGVADAGSVRPRLSQDFQPPLRTYSRWKKSAGTFGPAGRVVATLLLLVPLPVFGAAIATGFGIIGGGIYIIVVMPWALRDIWKRAAIPIEAPDQVVTPARF
jgi:hypothetical protein